MNLAGNKGQNCKGNKWQNYKMIGCFDKWNEMFVLKSVGGWNEMFVLKIVLQYKNVSIGLFRILFLIENATQVCKRNKVHYFNILQYE